MVLLCVYMYVSLPNIINPVYIEKLREMFPAPNQSTVAVCNQIILLIPYYKSSKPLHILKVTDAL
jgi:hypothetical protein